CLSSAIKSKHIDLTRTSARLRPDPLKAEARRHRQKLVEAAVRARPALSRLIETRKTSLASQAKLLETLSYQATLDRGFAIVRDTDGKVLKSVSEGRKDQAVELVLSDGALAAQITGGSPDRSKAQKRPEPAPKKVAAKPSTPPPQGSLF
ncbi:MAG: exodeoxyribonuclease VII large subunit, partial [Henriciella sp.]|uniref:exodeoxyribonuclease VII large subunit n=1 Tax=Henriciella sp. TaxID=1968823 RepID=UPI003C74EAC7